MVSGSTTGNGTDALTSAEANKPPIYEALLNEMDAGTRAAVEKVGSQDETGDGSTPQHRSRVAARPGQQPAGQKGASS